MNQKKARHLRRLLRIAKNLDWRERSYEQIKHSKHIPYTDGEGKEQSVLVERFTQVLAPTCGRGLYKLAKHAIA